MCNVKRLCSNRNVMHVGVDENVIRYSLASRRSSYKQKLYECGINVSIFAKHFVRENTIDPRGTQHTATQRAVMIKQANNFFARNPIEDDDGMML